MPSPGTIFALRKPRLFTSGPHLESALRYQEAEESAVTDHLTGIPNARSLAIHLKRELARSSRENSTIGVLVCDLDGFKQVNDRFGHLKGNEVLQHVANGLRETCRGSDYLARMGGDEFVLVLPDLKEELSPSYLDRLRGVALEAGWTVCGEECLSMSVGAAIYPLDGCDAEQVIRRSRSPNVPCEAGKQNHPDRGRTGALGLRQRHCRDRELTIHSAAIH